MIGLDTNVLVRLFIDDEPRQARLARARFKEIVDSGDQLFVSHVVLIETVWALSSIYKLPKVQLVEVLDALFVLRGICLESPEACAGALRVFRDNAIDFTDCLIHQVHGMHNCDSTLSFDRGAIKVLGFEPL